MIQKKAIDLYAHTNPAFGALVLYSFTKGFTTCAQKCQAEEEKPSYPHFFLAFPILYSRKGRNSFEGTNQSTGFLNWLERCPEMRVKFADEVQAGKPICNNSILFAVAHYLLDTDGWYYWAVKKTPWRTPRWKVSTDERGKALSNARSLGVWMSKISLPDIFLSLGVRP